MVRYSTRTTLSPQEALDQAVAYFSGTLGLAVKEQSPCCVTLVGGGGYVVVSAENGNKQTQVEIESHEWDYQARQFISAIV